MGEENVIFTNNLNDDGSGEVEFNIFRDGSVNDESKNGFNISDEKEEKNEETIKESRGDEEDVMEKIKEDEGEVEEDEEEVKEKKSEGDSIVINKSKVALIEKLLQNIKENNDKIIQLLGGALSHEEEMRIGIGQISDESFSQNKKDKEVNGRIVEGVFDGENMIGPDGKQYSMPANYASKSKLVEGDIMKLTITDSGTFVYKQIGPIERKRVVGVVNHTENGNFVVIDENGKKWRVLTASVTYYKGQVGDEAVILVPKNGDSKWAAVDNVVRSHE